MKYIRFFIYFSLVVTFTTLFLFIFRIGRDYLTPFWFLIIISMNAILFFWLTQKANKKRVS